MDKEDEVYQKPLMMPDEVPHRSVFAKLVPFIIIAILIAIAFVTSLPS